jgi:EAL domain-containing protein (putative c-di-GMP-specific phosphodiesterase class I)
MARARQQIEDKIFNLFYPYTKQYSKPAIGYALVINNPMVNNMRLIMSLVRQSKRMGEFLAERQKYQSLYQLQKLILNRKISTVFQAIVDINSLEVIGYEALSRGPSDSELHSPLLMFLLALEFGLTFELDSVCRKTAFESARNITPDIKIFVNTLPMTIHDPEFRGQYLEDLFHDLKLKPENVVFEVNEALAIDNYDLFKGSLKDYSDIGIVHASDDIGRGHADLERILELAPGYMKLDISMVRDIDQSFIKQQMVRAMISLAHNINSKIIAEGVERKEEYAMLKELGVDYAQGYLFGRPSEKPTPFDKSLFC